MCRLDQFGMNNVQRYNKMFRLQFGEDLASAPLLQFEWAVACGLFNRFGTFFYRTSPEELQVRLPLMIEFAVLFLKGHLDL